MKSNLVAASALLFGLAACSTIEAPAETTEAVESVETVEVAAEETVAEIIPATPVYSAETFYQTTSYSLASSAGHAFSADGSSILLSSDETGVFNAVAMGLDGTQTPLTASETNAHFALSYFPNDDRILVTADSGGDELNHIYVRDLDGTLNDITPGDNVKASFGGWKDDNSVFYVWSNKRDSAAFDLYAYDPGTYASQLVFENSDAFSPGALSRSGQWLALDKSRTSADSDIYLVDLSSEDQTPVLITEHEGNIAYGTYDFTPDESALVFSTNEAGEFSQAWTHDIATGEKAPLIQADWDVSFVFYSPSGKYRISAVNSDGLTDLTIHNTETGDDLAIDGIPEGELGQIRFTRDESQLAFGLNTDTSPFNIYFADVGGAATRLTNALNQEIDEDDLVTASVERFEASDGVVIPGILYKPKDASADNPVPALVWVHGGPGGQSTRGYRAAIQHLVNNGYAVYAANNRGSSGYGKTFYHMDDKRHGQEDLRDIVEAGEYLRGLDWVNGDQVGVIGGSYGGYMTAAALTFHPDAFEVGVNIFGVTNWVRTLESIPPWWESFKEALYDEMGDPATDGERHRAISPLFHADQVTKPMLVVQGANDPRVLQVESDELVAALEENGVPVEYVLFPDEGHGFRRRENRITASNAYVKFLDEYLKGEAGE